MSIYIDYAIKFRIVYSVYSLNINVDRLTILSLMSAFNSKSKTLRFEVIVSELRVDNLGLNFIIHE